MSTRKTRPAGAALLPPLPETPTGADATREKLLQATSDLLFERAGSEPSVSQICRRAGVQVAMVSYCFGGKQQLLETLVRRTIDGVIAELDQLAAMDLPPEEMLRRHVGAIVRNFVRFPYTSQISERLRSGDRPVAAFGSSFAAPLTAFYADLLAAGADRGAFRQIDPALFFFSIVGMCEYLFSARGLLTSTGQQIDEALITRFIDHTIELVMHGIAAHD